MLIRSLQQVRVFESVVKAAAKYTNSQTQSKMHEYIQTDASILQARAQIDYATIEKESKGFVMIREFLFQEKQTDYQVNYPDKYLVPSGKWTMQEMLKMLSDEEKEVQTPSDFENDNILKNLEKDLCQKLTKYYENIGKKDYTFSVKEEIKKIELMTEKEFQEFMKLIKS